MSTEDTPPPLESEHVVKKPLIDDRAYTYFTLENGLRVLCVQDVDADKAAAALTIEVGHFQNPVSYLGLAHFLEHMIFMGTETFPDEDEFQTFIAEHNGRTNAYTSDEITCFFFDVNAADLEPALRRFGSFFSCPLLKPDCVDREKKAVHSEHEKNLTSDVWRQKQLVKTFLNSTHPYSFFSTGNADTLFHETIHSDVTEFYKKWYSSNISHLCVYGREPASVMRGWVEAEFGKYQNLGIDIALERERVVSLGSPYDPAKSLGKLVAVSPVRELRQLLILFPLPMRWANYRTDQFRMLGTLCGHEGHGSLYAYLKKIGLATALSAGRFYSFDGWSLWGAKVSLTPVGEEKWEDVLVAFFQYMEMVRQSRETPEERARLFQETKMLTQIAFDYADRQQPIGYVPGIAAAMRKFPPEDILASDLMGEFDEENFEGFLKQILVEKMLLFHISNSHEGQTDQTEKWYGSGYKVVDLSEDLLGRCRSAQTDESKFFFPGANEFVPKKTDVLPLAEEDDVEYPEEILSTEMTRAFYKRDNKFKRPKTALVMKLRCLAPISSANNAFMQAMMGYLIRDSLNEITYLAELAYFSFSVTGDKYGFTIQMTGFSDTIGKLLDMVVDRIFNLDIKEDRFLVVKEDTLRQYRNMKTQMPIMNALYHFTFCLNATPEFHFLEYAAVGESVTFEDMRTFYGLFKESRVRFLCIGNNPKDEVLQILRGIEEERLRGVRPILDTEMPRQSIVDLSSDLQGCERYESEEEGEECGEELLSGNRYCFRLRTFNEEDANACAVKGVSVGLRNMKSDVLLDLLGMLISSPFFETLRTQEQFGYMVGCRIFRFHNVQYMQFYIMGTSHTPPRVLRRLDRFEKEFKQYLEALTDEDFGKRIEALKSRYEQKFQKLDEEMIARWTEVETRQFRFTRPKELVAVLPSITKDDLVEFYDHYFLKEQHSFTIELYPKKWWDDMDSDRNPGYRYISEMLDMTKGLRTHPSFIKY